MRAAKPTSLPAVFVVDANDVPATIPDRKQGSQVEGTSVLTAGTR